MTPLEGVVAFARDMARVFAGFGVGALPLPVPHWASLQRFLSELYPSPDWVAAGKVSGYLGANGVPLRLMPHLPNTVSAALIGYTACSRRVLSVGEDLSLALQTAEFDSVLRLQDVQLPFSSFRIELGSPIPGVNGDDIPELLVYTMPAEMTGYSLPALGILGPCQSFASYVPTSRVTAQHLERILDGSQHPNIDHPAVVAEVRRLHAFFTSRHMVDFMVDLEGSRVLAVDPTHVDSELDPVGDMAARVVWGLAFYLQEAAQGAARARGTGSVARRSRQDRRRSRGTGVGTLLAIENTLEVGTTFSLSERGRCVLQRRVRTGVGACPSWVCSHTRRRPGRGADPDADFDVRVGAHLRLPEELGPGEGPRASRLKL